MGPWASAIVAVAAALGGFLVVMGFRGFIEALEHFSGRCAGCGRMTMLPLPPQSHRCRSCHYAGLPHPHLLTRLPQLRH